MLKKIAYVFVIVIFITSISTAIVPGKSEENNQFSKKWPTVYIEPKTITGLKVNDTFTIKVMVFNLTNATITTNMGTYPLGNLYGFDIKFCWDPTVLEYVDHTVHVPVEDYPDGVLYGPVIEVKNEVNVTTGTYHVAYSSMAFDEHFQPKGFNNPNNSSVIFDMTFKVLKNDTCTLHFTDLYPHEAIDPENPLPTIELKDTEGLPIPNDVRVAYFGEDISVSNIEITPTVISQGFNAFINVTVSNYGGLPENFTINLYYNKTKITDWENPAGVEWEPILPVNEKNETVEEARFEYPREYNTTGMLVVGQKNITFTWNTTKVLEKLGLEEATFYIKANITQLPNEANIKNNQLISNQSIHITSELYRDVAITDFEILVEKKFPPPIISGESTKISFNVLNNGTVPETDVNVTFYYITPNNTKIYLLKNITSIDVGSKQYFEYSWNTTGLVGKYTFKVEVSEVPQESDITNNIYEKEVWVVIPPTLNVSISKTKVKVGETVIFNATQSYHNTPGGEIVRWEWKVYKEYVKPENLVYTYNESGILTYTIEEYVSYYRVLLTITDNFGLSYDDDRPASKSYYWGPMSILVEPAEEEAEGGFPLTYIGVIIVIIIIIIAIAAYYYKAKREET